MAGTPRWDSSCLLHSQEPNWQTRHWNINLQRGAVRRWPILQQDSVFLLWGTNAQSTWGGNLIVKIVLFLVWFVLCYKFWYWVRFSYFSSISSFSFPHSHAYLLSPQVHMPVFFYIDPEFVDDPKMQNVEMLTLSYTFFEAREGLQLPMPQFAR